MKACKKTILALVSSAVVLGGCATGAQYRADSYNVDMVNTAQDVTPVVILALKPAKVQVDNTAGKKNAQIGGAVVGALVGGLIGSNHDRPITGTAIGGVAGAAAGSLVDDKVLVDATSIVFTTGKGKKPKTSTQVGRVCEFKMGDAFMFTSKTNETRIQPNNPGGCEGK